MASVTLERLNKTFGSTHIIKDVDLKVGDSTWNVGFDDWMYLLQDGVLLNRAYVTRWGIRIGEVTIAFRK